MLFLFPLFQILDAVFPFTYAVDLLEGNLTVSNFSSSLLKKITSATHVNLQFVVVGLDFEHQSSFVQNCSNKITISLQDATEANLEFNCALPESPNVFGLLYLEFFQRVNAVDYDLQAGALKIVGFR